MLRKATVEDVPMLCEARRRQLVDEGLDPVIDIDEELRRYFEGALADGTIVEWVLEEEGELVATAALCLMPFLPSYNNPVGTRGYVTNMYTVPSHRGRGIATRMLAVLMDEARAGPAHGRAPGLGDGRARLRALRVPAVRRVDGARSVGGGPGRRDRGAVLQRVCRDPVEVMRAF